MSFMPTRKLNILFVSEYFYQRLAGGEVWSYELCTALAKKGHKTTVLTTRYNPKLAEDEKINNIHILRLHNNTINTTNRFSRYLSQRQFNKKVCRYIQEHKNDIDIIHTVAYSSNVPVSKTAKKLDIPCMTSIHAFFGKDWMLLSPLGKVIQRSFSS